MEIVMTIIKKSNLKIKIYKGGDITRYTESYMKNRVE